MTGDLGNIMNLFSTPYILKSGGASGGYTGNAVSPETTTVPAGQYTEAMPINVANQIDVAVTFTIAATGNVEIQRSPTQDFANYEVLQTQALPSSGTIASLNYPGISASAFLRVFNNTNLAITARIQEHVGI